MPAELGAVIIESPSMLEARMTAVLPRLAPGVPFGEGLTLSAEMTMAITPEEIGKMIISGVVAAELRCLMPAARGEMC